MPRKSTYPFIIYYFSSLFESLLLCVGGGEVLPRGAAWGPSCGAGARLELGVACSHLCCANPLRAFVPKDASYSKYEQEVRCDPAGSISMEPC